LQQQMNADPTGNGTTSGSVSDPLLDQQKQSEEFSDADLAMDLREVTRAANRANTTIYTIDPRGLVAGGDIEEQVDPTEWNDYLRKSQDSLRVLAEDTGGLAVVNQNDFDKALKRIDAESSDYYVLGYYSSNPDPTKRRRQVAIKVTRPKLSVTSQRTEYVLKPPPRPPSTPRPPSSTRRKP
jgi:VWFA-related protein